jgi:DNA-binding transcriptional MerR regulator
MIGEFAKLVGVVPKTLQRWDREGRLKAQRTVTNQRYYTDEDLTVVLG